MPNTVVKFNNADFALIASGKRKAFTASGDTTFKTGDLLSFQNSEKVGQYVTVEVTDINETVVSFQLPETYRYKK